MNTPKKLDITTAIELRARRAEGATFEELAKQYGIARSFAANVCAFRSHQPRAEVKLTDDVYVALQAKAASRGMSVEELLAETAEKLAKGGSQ